jgi:hypothetical protein
VGKKYTVARNRCNCHPETCCCDPWVILDPNGKRFTTVFDEKTAHTIANAMNEKRKERGSV